MEPSSSHEHPPLHPGESGEMNWPKTKPDEAAVWCFELAPGSPSILCSRHAGTPWSRGTGRYRWAADDDAITQL
jgi:hypothetical protein